MAIYFRVDEQRQDELVTALWEKGTLGVVEEADGWRAFFDDGVDVSALGGEVQSVIAEQEMTAESSEPILVGERFFVASPSTGEMTPPGRIRLEIAESRAFGTGRHETTQLCLEAMEQFVRPHAVVLDVGCGSGILSNAAALLGSGDVAGCDIDEEAVRALWRSGTLDLFIGSADAIAAGFADLVLANISAAVLDRLAFDLRRVMKPDGRLLISGFMTDRTPRCYRPAESYEKDGWLCWVCGQEDVMPWNDYPASGLSHEKEWWL